MTCQSDYRTKRINNRHASALYRFFQKCKVNIRGQIAIPRCLKHVNNLVSFESL